METDSMEYIDDEYYDYYNEDDDMATTSRNIDGAGGSKSNKNSMNKMRTSLGLNSSYTHSQQQLAVNNSININNNNNKSTSKFKSQFTSMPMQGGGKRSGVFGRNNKQSSTFLQKGEKILHEEGDEEDIVQEDSKGNILNRSGDNYNSEGEEDELKEGMYMSNSKS